jgi:hypothetical protein
MVVTVCEGRSKQVCLLICQMLLNCGFKNTSPSFINSLQIFPISTRFSLPLIIFLKPPCKFKQQFSALSASWSSPSNLLLLCSLTGNGFCCQTELTRMNPGHTTNRANNCAMLRPQVLFLCSVIFTLYLACLQPTTAQITAPWEGKIHFIECALRADLLISLYSCPFYFCLVSMTLILGTLCFVIHFTLSNLGLNWFV